MWTSTRCSGSPWAATAAIAICSSKSCAFRDAGPRLDRSFFSTERLNRGGFSARFYERLGLKDGAPIPEALRAHVAAGIQKAVEAAVIRMAGEGRNLCLAGGLGLNALLVSALENRSGFENVFVQPAVGQCRNGHRRGARNLARRLPPGRSAWRSIPSASAPPTPRAEIKQVLENCKLRFRYLLTMDELIGTAVAQLNDNKIVAWMHGRMEFGARALGNRSILASPLDPYSTENLNIFIKHREPFRKFAASVPAELCDRVFRRGNQRALSRHHRPRQAGAPRQTRGGRSGRRPGARPHRGSRREPALLEAAPRRRQSHRACRCSTTRRSISSASRWSAPRATPCAASTPPASTPCSWATSSCRSRGPPNCPSPDFKVADDVKRAGRQRGINLL